MELLILLVFVAIVALGVAYWADHAGDGDDESADIKA